MSMLLENTQREFFQALLLPLRGSSRLSTDLPPCNEPHPAEFLETADRLVRPGPNLIPAEGLELYHRQYWFRLLDSLSEDFPQLRRLLGETEFWEIIERSLLDHPSESFTLRHLGRKMPEIVAATGDAFAESVAKLEWAMMEAFEQAELPAPDADDFASTVIRLQPHVRLLDLPVSAGRWIEEESAISTDDYLRPSLAVVWRSAAGSVCQRTENRAALPLLSSLEQGGYLSELLESHAEILPVPEVLQEWFQRWQRLGWLARAS